MQFIVSSLSNNVQLLFHDHDDEAGKNANVNANPAPLKS